MSSTYSSLKIELIGTGEQAGFWGATTNTNLGTALEEAIVGRADVAFATDADLTLTLTDSNSTQIARHFILNVTGTLTATRNLTVPAIDKPYIIENNTAQTIIVKTSGGVGVPVPNGRKMFLYAFNNGATNNVVEAFNYVSALYAGTLTLTSPLPIASGGTGSAVTAYCSLVTNVTGTLPIANGGTGQVTANAAVNALLPAQAGYNGLFLTTNGTDTAWAAASGGGGGTVSSVNASGGTTGMTFSGGPILSAGTLTMAGTLAVANGGTGATTHSVNGLLTGNGTSAVNTIAPGTNGQVLTSNGTNWYAAAFTAGNVTGPLSSTNLAIPTFSGASGTILLNNSGATISGGTVTAVAFVGDGASITGLSTGNISSGTLSVARGGTNSTATPTAGGAGYGTGTAHAYTAAGTSGQVLTSNGAAAPTWQTPTTGVGTVFSVAAGNGMTFTTITGSGSVTMGTPTTLTSATTNAVSAGTHAHAVTGIPTTYTWTAGTTAGPTGALTGSGSSSVSYAAIPSASATASGIITTGAQTLAGVKTFAGIIATSYNFSTTSSIYLSGSTVNLDIASVGITDWTNAAFAPATDNVRTLGTAAQRWTTVYATTGTINTSDANTKQDIADLDAAELRVATNLKGMIKKFRFKDAVAEKGSAARIHVGVIAQDVQAAFVAEGLNPAEYGMFCSDTWWEREETTVVNDVPRTRIVAHNTFVEGGTERTRLGIRYEELFAFMIAAL